MPSFPIPLIIAACLLMLSCSGPKGAGALRIEPPPPDITSPCDHPSKYLGAGDWEAIAGRAGDGLIECGKEKAVLVAYYDALVAAVSAQ